MPAAIPNYVNETTRSETVRQIGTDAAAGRSGGGTPARAGVHLLRAVLRQTPEGRTPAAQRTVDALIDDLRRPLLRYCEGLTRQTGGRGSQSAAIGTGRGIDAEDLAQEAWAKALRYLAGPGGDRVGDDDHLKRLLRCAAKSVFLDRVTKGGAPTRILELDAPLAGSGGSGGDGEDRSLLDSLAVSMTQQQRQRTEGVPGGLLLADERYAPLIDHLFNDEEGFHRTYRRKHQRRPRQYQALVLYQLGIFYRSEVMETGDTAAAASLPAPDATGADLMESLIDRYVGLLNIPEERWRPVARAAAVTGDEGGGVHEPILAAVNAVCGTNIRAANMLAVLRYELNQFAEGGKEGAKAKE